MEWILLFIVVVIPMGILVWNKNYICAGICLALCVFMGIEDGSISIVGGTGMLLLPLETAVFLISYIKRRRKEKKSANQENVIVPENKTKETIIADGVQAEFSEIKDGVKIYKAKNVSKEESDRLIAQTNFNVGVALVQGDGVEKDVKKGLEFLRLAADGGNIDAQHNLGTILLVGKLAPKDAVTGVEYLKLAADAGAPNSQFNLALALLEGDGVEKNVNQAIQYLESSAKKGYTDSMVELCKIYANSKYIEQDLEKAEEWAKSAMKSGAGDTAKEFLGIITKMKNEQKPIKDKEHMTPEEKFSIGIKLAKEKNVKEAIKYIEAATDAEYTEAQYFYGILLLEGKDISKNPEKAAHYLKLAADKGHAGAQYDYSVILGKGIGVKQDLVLSGEYLEKSAENGDVRSMLVLSGAYAVGMFVKQINYDKAEYWAKKAIDVGARQEGEMRLKAIAAERNKHANAKPDSRTQSSLNENAWKVKAFVNLIKKGEITGDSGGYYMNGETMDGLTLYDAFVSIRFNLSYDLAEETISNIPMSAMNIMQNLYPRDANASGMYGCYEDMYEFRMEEFYSLFVQYFD